MERVTKLKVSYALTDSASEVPFIRLRGKYLRQFDFDVGDQVLVTISPSKIEIVKPRACKEEFVPLYEPDRIKRLMKIGELSGRSPEQVLRFLGKQELNQLSDEDYVEAISRLINKPIGIFKTRDIKYFMETNEWRIK